MITKYRDQLGEYEVPSPWGDSGINAIYKTGCFDKWLATAQPQVAYPTSLAPGDGIGSFVVSSEAGKGLFVEFYPNIEAEIRALDIRNEVADGRKIIAIYEAEIHFMRVIPLAKLPAREKA